jgi:hypothetical protein
MICGKKIFQKIPKRVSQHSLPDMCTRTKTVPKMIFVSYNLKNFKIKLNIGVNRIIVEKN